jgi:hypothetical protein
MVLKVLSIIGELSLDGGRVNYLGLLNRKDF